MIGYDDVLPLFSAACPSYEASPEAAKFDERDGPYVDLGCFVTHLVRLLDEGKTACMPAVFAVVEQVLVEGDEEARHLVTGGFLSDLGSPTSYEGSSVQPRDFAPWFGPQARCDRHVRFLLAERLRMLGDGWT